MDTRTLHNNASHPTTITNMLRVPEAHDKHLLSGSNLIAKPLNINLSTATGNKDSRNFHNDLTNQNLGEYLKK